MTAECSQCTATISPEDAAYDERQAQYFCKVDCFRDWEDDNHDELTDFYERMNVN